MEETEMQKLWEGRDHDWRTKRARAQILDNFRRISFSCSYENFEQRTGVFKSCIIINYHIIHIITIVNITGRERERERANKTDENICRKSV
jgi:hypothetical protein